MAREKQGELLGQLFEHFGRRLKAKLEGDPDVQALIDKVLTEERADLVQRVARLPKDRKVRMFERLALHLGVGNLNEDNLSQLVMSELERAEGQGG